MTYSNKIGATSYFSSFHILEGALQILAQEHGWFRCCPYTSSIWSFKSQQRTIHSFSSCVCWRFTEPGAESVLNIHIVLRTLLEICNFLCTKWTLLRQLNLFNFLLSRWVVQLQSSLDGCVCTCAFLFLLDRTYHRRTLEPFWFGESTNDVMNPLMIFIIKHSDTWFHPHFDLFLILCLLGFPSYYRCLTCYTTYGCSN
jgi:hypothetical protein